ncbi:hypothetical protein XM53_15205 [Roseovarius atlanticus]|uniref:Heparan-alpha-glucosaminide N-acetyltransferase catalytic domain-containing protein n=1 Tax=Roseovarius atlanticus TaxID=1641875 RepID=A0A0T5NSC8_9RHOB|nr:heparan-alpha-glucosaminide N-acetyltransferase [Roseovarius atlanticus]KRS11622.1 hypothetical protein XM53_15205 [Roseovarius atlanticus]
MTERIHAIDLARGLALVAMVIFHLFYDLTMFMVLPSDTMRSIFWQVFASLTAGTFIFIAGISLWLAHGDRVRWRSFAKRLGILVLASFTISIATYLFAPQRFIYFGILHSITLSSLVGLLFLRCPIFLGLMVAGFCFLLPSIYESAIFDRIWLLWTGLSQTRPPSMDYEPFFPWFGVFLLGVITARFFNIESLSRDANHLSPAPRAASAMLVFLGRNSLLVYLVHQPLLLALLWIGVKGIDGLLVWQ